MTRATGTLKADGLLLLTALIWGFAFVAQRTGMQSIGPFAYTAARFALGALCMLPLLILHKRRSSPAAQRSLTPQKSLGPLAKLGWAALVGFILFMGANLQQVGLVYTTAANAGFITSLYVILVPLMGLCLGRPSGWRTWIGAILAVIGLFILSVGTGFTMAPGDLLQLAGAFFWAGHILLINRLVTRMEALEIAVGQFLVCSLLSLLVALVREPAAFAGLKQAALPILYGGLLSIGVAYTLQIIAQKTAQPAHASIILSMEALFAGIGGVLILHEPLTLRLALGGLLMLVGMIVSQLEPRGGHAGEDHDGLATSIIEASAGERQP
jgi:drug/metabolite transporter (DMT)-like permease